MNLCFRLYDPTIGRFLSVDPLFETQIGVTPYHYFGNDPVNFSDPLGLDVFDCGQERYDENGKALWPCNGSSEPWLGGNKKQIIGSGPREFAPIQIIGSEDMTVYYDSYLSYLYHVMSTKTQSFSAFGIEQYFRRYCGGGGGGDSPSLKTEKGIMFVDKSGKILQRFSDGQDRLCKIELSEDPEHPGFPYFTLLEGYLFEGIDVFECAYLSSSEGFSIFGNVYVAKGTAKDRIDHEKGHAVQNRIMGNISYILNVAIPSILSAKINSVYEHSKMTFEQGADFWSYIQNGDHEKMYYLFKIGLPMIGSQDNSSRRNKPVIFPRILR